MSWGTDIDVARVFNHRYAGANKALELQTEARGSDDGSISDASFGVAFSSWCLVAVPKRPEKDGHGNLIGACEALTFQYGDEVFSFATRDVRTFRFGQDVQPGEVALFNAWGSRLMLGETSVALSAFGGFIAWDSSSKTVSLVGIPSSPGAAAPYISLSTTGVGLVSATGAASAMVEAAGVTLSGSTIALDAGSIAIGKGASEPIVTYSMLFQVIAQINAALAMMPGPPPPVVPPMPGKRVLVPMGG